MLLWDLPYFLLLIWFIWKARSSFKCKRNGPTLCSSGTTMEPESGHKEHVEQEEAAGPSKSEECHGHAESNSSHQTQLRDSALVNVASNEIEPKQLKFGPSKGNLSKSKNADKKKPPLSRFILGSSEDNSSDDESATGFFKIVRKSSLTSSTSQTPSLSSLPETEPLPKTIR